MKIIILQHPQEHRESLREGQGRGTVPLIQSVIPNAQVHVGLSWPSLAKALKQERVDPRRWGVLYLGSKTKKPHTVWESEPSPEGKLAIVSEKSSDLIDDVNFEGIIAIDGNWSQAKTLWWRNAWMLKMHRLTITPKKKSRYGVIRREPRKEAVSTLEALAITLGCLNPESDIPAKLIAAFEAHLDQFKAKPKQKPETDQKAETLA